MPPNAAVLNLDLKKTESLTVSFADGKTAVFPLTMLRARCPCALCKTAREEQMKKRSLLTILPGNYAGQISVVKAHLVGNYALQIDWSDNHGSGIYSFTYLRELADAG